jgi:hypothetical protein
MDWYAEDERATVSPEQYVHYQSSVHLAVKKFIKFST